MCKQAVFKILTSSYKYSTGITWDWTQSQLTSKVPVSWLLANLFPFSILLQVHVGMRVDICQSILTDHMQCTRQEQFPRHIKNVHIQGKYDMGF